MTVLKQHQGLSPAEHLAAIVESSDDAIASKDLDGIIQSWNQGAERIFGWRADEIIGRSVLTLIPADRHHEEVGILDQLRKGERVQHFETVRQRKDGSLIDVSLTISPVRDASGRIIGASKIARDISEKKRAQDQLDIQSKRLEILHRAAREISRDLNLDRIVQSVTDLATEVSGAKFGAFFYNVLDQKGEWYQLYSLSGAPRQAFDQFGMPRNTAVFEHTFRGLGIVRSDDIRQDPRYGKKAPHYGMPKGHLPVVSYLAVPVMSASGYIHGGLFFGHDQPGIFTEDAEFLVSAIAGQAAVAMDNARLHQSAQREIEERKKAEDAKELLLHEIKHRVKNTLGTIQAIVMQTFRSAPNEEHAAFGARLRAMSDAHDLLTQRNWSHATTLEIVERATAPFDGEGKRIHFGGPTVEIGPSKALVLAMLLHELCTNAVKYGTLSDQTGHVHIDWSVDQSRFSMTWRENGGPAVTPPTRKGFGSRMIEKALRAEGGDAKLLFEAAGLVCQIEISL